MNKLLEALKNTGIPAPAKDTETFKIVRWGRNNRYWLRKFEGGYVFGDFVENINSYVFDKEYKGNELQKIREKMHKTLENVERESKKIHEATAKKAQNIWNSSRSISSTESPLNVSRDAISEPVASTLPQHKDHTVDGRVENGQLNLQPYLKSKKN